MWLAENVCRVAVFGGRGLFNFFCEVFMDSELMCLNCQYYERIEGEYVCCYPDWNTCDDWEVPCFRESEVLDE